MIIQEVKTLINEIEKEGRLVRDTKEIIGWYMSFFKGDINYNIESAEIQEFYREKLGDEAYLAGKLGEEVYNYKYILSGIKQKEREIKYFFNENPFETRKLLVQNPLECISSVHLIHRADRDEYLVYIRSTDVVGLLPVDIYGFMQYVIEYHTRMDWALKIFIGSAHMYNRGYRDASRIL